MTQNARTELDHERTTKNEARSHRKTVSHELDELLPLSPRTQHRTRRGTRGGRCARRIHHHGISGRQTSLATQSSSVFAVLPASPILQGRQPKKAARLGMHAGLAPADTQHLIRRNSCRWQCTRWRRSVVTSSPQKASDSDSATLCPPSREFAIDGACWPPVKRCRTKCC